MNPNSRILLWKGNQAIIKTDDEIRATSKAALHAEFENYSMSLPEARQNLLMENVKDGIILSPFEVKQCFVERGDFANAEKANRLQTEQPKKAVQTIGAELVFFGQSFLEGFLDFYGVKCENALENYEKRIDIIEEHQLDTGERKSSIYQVIKGKFEKLAEYDTLQEARKAQEKLETNQEPEHEMDMYRRLNHEKDN